MTIFLDANQNRVEKPEGEKTFWRLSVYPLVQKDDNILMVVPKWNSLWELPGGGIELEEGIFEGMVRECYEETGYKVEATAKSAIYVGESNFYHRSAKKFFHSVIMVFPARLIREQQDKHVINTLDGDEIKKVDWVSLTECTEKNCHPIIWPAINIIKNTTGATMPEGV